MIQNIILINDWYILIFWFIINGTQYVFPVSLNKQYWLIYDHKLQLSQFGFINFIIYINFDGKFSIKQIMNVI